MPRYRVIERRAYKVRTLIDAEDDEAAKRGEGEIIDEVEEESWADALEEIEEVDPEEDCA